MYPDTNKRPAFLNMGYPMNKTPSKRRVSRERESRSDKGKKKQKKKKKGQKS